MQKIRNVMIKGSVLICAAFMLLLANPANTYEWPGVYDPIPTQLITLNLDMEPADWETVKGDTTFDIEVEADFWADGESSIVVSVRRKSADALGDKVSLKIDINEYVDDQKWSGVKKLSLENGDDVNVVAEGFAWYLHRLAAEVSGDTYKPGLAAWVKLYVNGNYQGVYVNVEQRDKTFLKNRGLFTSNETWLYKADGVRGSFELKVGDPDSPKNAILCYSPFGADGNCTAPGNDDDLEEQLNSLINMEVMLTMGAVNAFNAGRDLMFSKGHNFYYIDFLADESKRLYVPWDLDTVFVKKRVDASIYGSEKRMGGTTVLSQTAYQELILNHETFRNQYNQIMAGLLNGPLHVDVQLDFLNSLESLLTSALEEDVNNNFGDGTVSGQFDALRQWVKDRVENINAQLAADAGI